jgi:hypothetical protein
MRPSQRLSPAEPIEESEGGAKSGAVVAVESREKAVLCVEGWAGRGEIPCEIVRETSHRLVIRVEAECPQLGGRFVKAIVETWPARFDAARAD